MIASKIQALSQRAAQRIQAGTSRASAQLSRAKDVLRGREDLFGTDAAKSGALLGSEASRAPPSTLRSLVDSGRLDRVIALQRQQQIGEIRSTSTRTQIRAVPVLSERADLAEVDQCMRDVAGGALWENLANSSRARMDRIDRVADGLRLPPEGIHPDFALAAKPLLKLVDSRLTSSLEVEAADNALAKLVKESVPLAAASAEVFLRQFGVDAQRAPRTFAALNEALPPFPQRAREWLDAACAARASGDKGRMPELDKQLAELGEALAPVDLLRFQHELAVRGVIDDRLTFFGWKSCDAYPLGTAQMARRDVRGETLRPYLLGDAEYRKLTARTCELHGLVVNRLHEGRRGNPLAEYIARAPVFEKGDIAGVLTNWALQQKEKLRFVDDELSAPPLSSSTEMSKRTLEETFLDHLRARRVGDLDADLQRNYHPDLIFTSNQGNFFGREDVHNSAAVLARLVKGRQWTMERLVFLPGKSPTEGTVVETWSAQIKGKLVTAVDNFYVRDGKIEMQSAYYLDPRPELRLDLDAARQSSG